MPSSEIEDRFKWTKQKELDHEGHDKFFNKKYGKAEKLFLKALKAKDDNPIDRHFVYNHLIELYYKLRDERKDALEKCFYYCKEDINRLPQFLRSYKNEYSYIEADVTPRCPSVQQLAIIYEKKEKFQEAVDLCNYAINLGLDDGTKGGFQGRIKRLENKMNLKK